MESSATNPSTFDHTEYAFVRTNDFSPCKAIGFAIVIILGVGGLAVAGAGVAGYLKVESLCFKIGSFSNLTQVNAIALMAGGSVVGATLLAIGIVGSVKNCDPAIKKYPRVKEPTFNEEADSAEGVRASKEEEEFSAAQSNQISHSQKKSNQGKVYGIEALETAGVQNLSKDDYLPMPLFDWQAIDPFFEEPYHKNYVALFIPGQSSCKQNFTVQDIQKHIKPEVKMCFEDLQNDFDKDCRSSTRDRKSKWVLMSTKPIPNMTSKTYNTMTKELSNKGFRLPNIFQMTVLVLLVDSVRQSKASLVCSDTMYGGPDFREYVAPIIETGPEISRNVNRTETGEWTKKPLVMKVLET